MFEKIHFDYEGRKYRAMVENGETVISLEIRVTSGWRRVSLTSVRSVAACNANGYMVPEE